jgi:hypothetical protein
MSQQSLEPGVRWSEKLAEQLMETDFGIICVTKDNASSPWLNFEAGSLAKQIERSRVVPYLIDLSTEDLKGPLSQFQSVYSNQSGTQRLFSSIREAIEQPTQSVFDIRFTNAWAKLESQITTSTIGSREDPDSEIALKLCYLLLEKGYVRDVAEQLATPRHSRGLPADWLSMAAAISRLTGNRNSERLIRELSALEGQFGEISRYENSLLNYARGADRQSIIDAAGDHPFADDRLDVSFRSLLMLCDIEQKLQPNYFGFPTIELSVSAVDPYFVFSGLQLAIVAAACGDCDKTEKFFDLVRKSGGAGTTVIGYPFVPLLVPISRLFSDVIAGFQSGTREELTKEAIGNSLRQSSILSVRGHLHVVARYAKAMCNSNPVLNTLERMSENWDDVLKADKVRARLLLLRKHILQVAGNP